MWMLLRMLMVPWRHLSPAMYETLATLKCLRLQHQSQVLVVRKRVPAEQDPQEADTRDQSKTADVVERDCHKVESGVTRAQREAEIEAMTLSLSGPIPQPSSNPAPSNEPHPPEQRQQQQEPQLLGIQASRYDLHIMDYVYGKGQYDLADPDEQAGRSAEERCEECGPGTLQVRACVCVRACDQVK
jgi:hypothetical protein